MDKIIHILLVEDSPGDTLLFKEVLRDVDGMLFTVQSVISMEEIAVVKHTVNTPSIDIIVLDLNLPDSSGLDTLHDCKEIFPETPVIVFSGYDDEELAINAVKSGAQDYLVKGSVEGQAIARTINHAIERHALWLKLEQAEKREHYLAMRDQLTGLPNRYNLLESLENKIAICARQTERMAVVFMDVDRFKSINDSLGHLIGDTLLIEVAQRLQQCIRKTDMVARLGGDEFVLVLSNLKSQNDAARICEKVIHRLAQPIKAAEHELYISCSMGIALYPEDAKNYESIIKHADVAMYSAKDAGRNCYRFYSQKMTEHATQRLSIENEMRRAVGNQAFSLVYQPIYDANKKLLSGVEALIRWPREDGTTLNPIDFIGIAEETGLIIPMGEYVLQEACKQAKNWSDSGFPHITVSVNVSAKQFEQKEFIETVSRILAESGLNPEQLILELTEHVIMSDAEIAAVTLNKLKEMNIKLAIDDFGTGYSSLSYLSRFPIDTLKIDKSFIHNLEKSEKDLALVEAIVMLAKRLGLAITAEGVETARQCEKMQELGCDWIQGFHFSRPMKPALISSFAEV